jgi:hypothetical protein
MKSIERFEFAFRKLLGEIKAEFVQNLKGPVDFEVRTWITKKRLFDAEALPSIHASIHRSLVSPTALYVTKVPSNKAYKQCCGSGMFVLDPDFYLSWITDLRSRIPDPSTATTEKREKYFLL